MNDTRTVTAYSRDVNTPLLSRTEGICGGRLVIYGTRIEVSMIKQIFRRGHSVQDILTAYPNLTEGQVLYALNYKARRSEI